MFVQAVRELAEANGQAGPARVKRILTAADHLGTALVEWDRRVSALRAQAEREIAGAPARRAYELHVELGVAYRTRGRLAESLREFDAAVALQPSSDVQVLRALTLQTAGRRDEAGRAYREAWSLDARNPIKAYYVAQRAGASAAERDRVRALLTDTYRALTFDGTRPPSPPFVALGVIPDTLGSAPVIADEATARGVALLQAEQYDAAVAALRRMDHEGQDRSGAESSPLAHFRRGQRDEAANRVADARREYEAALAGALTGRSALQVAIARLAQVDGDASGAIDALAEAARINPNDPNIHKELAAAYAAEGRADEAFCELMAAVLIDRRDAQAHAAIGRLYLDTGRDAEAVAALGRALQLKPEFYEVRYALATAFTRLGNTAEAARQLETYDRLRREALERRRRDIDKEVEQEERSRAR
jgi:tetratricopeptide (TPR) repeat protein